MKCFGIVCVPYYSQGRRVEQIPPKAAKPRFWLVSGPFCLWLGVKVIAEDRVRAGVRINIRVRVRVKVWDRVRAGVRIKIRVRGQGQGLGPGPSEGPD